MGRGSRGRKGRFRENFGEGRFSRYMYVFIMFRVLVCFYFLLFFSCGSRLFNFGEFRVFFRDTDF